METSPRRKRRGRTSGPYPAEHAVAAAEEIVGDAWARALTGHRDLKQAERRAASAISESARRTLATALEDSVPRRIATAHTDLEQALAAERAASQAFDEAQGELVHELDLMEKRATEHRTAAAIPRNGASQTPGRCSARHKLGQPAGPQSALARIYARSLRWILPAVTRLLPRKRSS